MFLFLLWNFFSLNAYDYLTAPLSIIYTATLGLYVGTKEFERWREFYTERHPGELFVLLWTVLMVFFIGVSFALGPQYKIPSEATAVYIMVLSIFTLTRRSKTLCAKKSGK